MKTKSLLLNSPSHTDSDSLEHLNREDLIKMLKTMMDGGVALSFHGKRTVREIEKKVRPRVIKVVDSLCVGSSVDRSNNVVIEGENLQAMVTLYKYRGQVDLILTDPPYNTGQQFRYNDKWEQDPNDPDLGTIVSLDDGSRHTKWIKAMMPRLNMMKAMLKPNGVIAICIDDNELFHLGMMMDEVFGAHNRIAIINWQKTFSPKNDSTHVSTATEYVLIYAKDIELAKTNLLPRDEKMNKRFSNPDNDVDGVWAGKDPTAKEFRKNTVFGIQSPFSGYLHYPDIEHAFDGELPQPQKHWTGISKKDLKTILEEWGSEYVEKDLGDNRGSALVLKGSRISLTNYDPKEDPIVIKAQKLALQRKKQGRWPRLIFLDRGKEQGCGRPRIKNHLKAVKQGKVPLTYWAEDDYDTPLVLGSQSWHHTESGHSDSAKKELNNILGLSHHFETVKPLLLMKKIIQLWCPPNGLVLDPYAGSGTTGHAVLSLNVESQTHRRFILVEQGQNGDKYARSLTQVRLARAISGQRPNNHGKLIKTSDKLPGGFEFHVLLKQIDAKTVLSMKKDELIDVVITSHWEDERPRCNLIRIDDTGFIYLVGKNEQNEGFFIIWNGRGPIGQLDATSYKIVVKEANKAALNPPYHVYARYEIYQARNVNFYKIPDKILAHLGLNENCDSFNEEEEEGN